MTLPSQKHCRACDRTKPAAEFYVNRCQRRRKSTGETVTTETLQTPCKLCMRLNLMRKRNSLTVELPGSFPWGACASQKQAAIKMPVAVRFYQTPLANSV